MKPILTGYATIMNGRDKGKRVLLRLFVEPKVDTTDCRASASFAALDMRNSKPGMYEVLFHLPKDINGSGRKIRSVSTLIEVPCKKDARPLGLRVVGPNGMVVTA
jgi:hypothetical protein